MLGTEGADARERFRPYVALHAGYALDPIVLRDANGDEVGPVVQHLVSAHLVGTVNLFAGFEVGLAAPMTLYASGDDAIARQAGLPDPQGAAMGDLQLRMAYRLQLSWRSSLALHLPIRFPTSPDDDLMSLGFGVKPTLAFLHGFDHVDLLFNLAYLYRSDEQELDFDGGQELEARVAARIGIDEHWNTSVVAELGVATQVNDFFSGAGTPAEGRVGLEHWLNPSWRIGGFVGTGLSRGVGAPDFRAGVHIAFGVQPRRPRLHTTEGDKDGDGIPDEDDRCPEDPEDLDGFEDDDGCPDEDNDSDGYLDVDDPCPDDPETEGGLSDDGCPDRVVLEEGGLVLLQPVQFQTNSDEILDESEPLLDEIAEVMRRHPELRIRVEGHTDAIGPPDHNLELSQRRAESVRRHLIGEGIDEGRLEAHGYGETRPIATNRSREGRLQNRRVEFKIIGAPGTEAAPEEAQQ